MSQHDGNANRGGGWMRAVAVVLLAGLLTACALKPTPYQPKDRDGYGYSERLLETNRYRISFSGNSSTTRETVENYLLYRAAELTLSTGHDYFIVQQQDTEEHERGVNTFSTIRYPGFYYSVGGYWDRGLLHEVDTYRVITRYEAIAIIKVYKGEVPEDNVSAYDARDVRQTLETFIRRPGDEGEE